MILKRSVIVCCISVLLGLVGFALAQDDERPPYTPVYSGGWAQDVEWMPDSGVVTFVMQNKLASGEREFERYVYSVSDQKLELDETWNPAEQPDSPKSAAFDLPLVIDEVMGKPSLVYISPNEQFAVYAVDIGEVGIYEQVNRVYGLAITDLLTGETKLLEPVVIAYPSRPQNFDVIWSGDSSAFALNMNYGMFPYAYYIDNFSEDVRNARVQELFGWEGDIVEATNNIYAIVYDVDFSGDHLLLDIHLDMEGGPDKTHYFAEFNIHELTYDLIERECLGTVAYEKPGYEIVNVLSCEGVLTYEVASGEKTVRNPEIASQWLRNAEFSPDGNYIAGSGGSPKSKFYVIEIDAELPAQTVTSTPIP